MKMRKDIQKIVWDKIREINNGSPTLSASHSSDDQFVELVEYFLPQIDETADGQDLADMIFVSRSFESIEDDDILCAIKSDLGILDVPNSKEYVEQLKQKIQKNIIAYKTRISQ